MENLKKKVQKAKKTREMREFFFGYGCIAESGDESQRGFAMAFCWCKQQNNQKSADDIIFYSSIRVVRFDEIFVNSGNGNYDKSSQLQDSKS